MSTAYDLLRNKEVPPEMAALLEPIFFDLAKNYFEKSFDKNYGPIKSRGPAILQHLEAYIRAESYSHAYRRKTLKRTDFERYIRSENIPSYLKPYYFGIAAYLGGDKVAAYDHFAQAGQSCERLVLTYGRYIESSIRGAISTVALSEMPRLLAAYDPAHIDQVFPIEILSAPSQRPAHIVGTDPVYWEKYESLFLNWATPLAEEVDIWVVCVNFSDELIETIQTKYPFLKLARIEAKFTNLVPFYTMARFLLAERLSRNGVATLICSDIDVFFEAERYNTFLARTPEGLSGVHHANGHVPWRSVAALFTVWKGANGQAALRFFVTFLAETFRPDAPAGNRQWWVDQVPLAMLADATELNYEGCPQALRCFHAVKRTDMPVRSPIESRMTKAEFAAAFGAQSS